MLLCISVSTIADGSAKIYSIIERPVPPYLNPPQDQILITVIANGTTSEIIAVELRDQLDILTTKLECNFTDPTRFGESLILQV